MIPQCVLVSSEYDSPRTSSDGTLLRMLDGMQHLMTGSSRFDRTFYLHIEKCLKTIDPDLIRVQDKAWQGIIDFWNSNGTESDPWGGTPSEYLECNKTVSNVNNMMIYEPCSYTSNIAYFYSLTEICLRLEKGKAFKLPPMYVTAIAKAVSMMPMASSFFHGSNTALGYQQDVSAISAIVYTAHQASVSAVEYSAALHELSEAPRALGAVQMVETLQDMYGGQPSSRWLQLTEDVQQPRMLLPIAAVALHTLNLNLKPDTTNLVAGLLLNSLGFTPEEKDVLLNSYLPEIQNLITNYTYPKEELRRVRKNSKAVLLKFIHSVLYIENRVQIDLLLFNPVVRLITNQLFPKVTKLINILADYEYFQSNFQKSTDIHPLEDHCNTHFPHSRWHVLSSLSLVDIVYFCDDLHHFFSLRQPKPQTKPNIFEQIFRWKKLLFA